MVRVTAVTTRRVTNAVGYMGAHTGPVSAFATHATWQLEGAWGGDFGECCRQHGSDVFAGTFGMQVGRLSGCLQCALGRQALFRVRTLWWMPVVLVSMS